MQKYTLIKLKVHEGCLHFLKNSFDDLNRQFLALSNSLLEETKSSAGDKHETGRAMVQLEMEKAGKQMEHLKKMSVEIQRIKPSESSAIIHLGSLVITTDQNYYLSISAGKIVHEGSAYYAISTASPIGKELLGKKIGDEIKRNGAVIMAIE